MRNHTTQKKMHRPSSSVPEDLNRLHAHFPQSPQGPEPHPSNIALSTDRLGDRRGESLKVRVLLFRTQCTTPNCTAHNRTSLYRNQLSRTQYTTPNCTAPNVPYTTVQVCVPHTIVLHPMYRTLHKTTSTRPGAHPRKILSTFSSSASMTPILEETFEPPTMAAKGRLGSFTAPSR